MRWIVVSLFLVGCTDSGYNYMDNPTVLDRPEDSDLPLSDPQRPWGNDGKWVGYFP